MNENTTNYKKLNRTMSLQLANVLSLIFFIPVIAIPGLLYRWIWDDTRAFDGLVWVWDHIFIALAIAVVLIVAHEMIHGLTWRLVSGADKDAVEFGIQWKTITPYAHVNAPMKVRDYRLGTIMPGMLTGLLPLIIGLAIGNPVVLVFGMYMTAAAGGDLLILWLLRKDPADALVEDHPDLAGCYLLVPTKEE